MIEPAISIAVTLCGHLRVFSTILCLLEAMKMFSPVSLNSSNKKDSVIYASDRKYVIERINNASGQQVSTGDLLFVVSPLEA